MTRAAKLRSQEGPYLVVTEREPLVNYLEGKGLPCAPKVGLQQTSGPIDLQRFSSEICRRPIQSDYLYDLREAALAQIPDDLEV